MLVRQKRWRLLAMAMLTASFAGCISMGSKHVEMRDPFVPSVAGSDSVKVPQPLPTVSSSDSKESEPSFVKLATFAEDFEVLPETIVESEPENLLDDRVVPIDLGNALGLGGADNLQVRLARTRLFQAQARHLEAKTLWLPSIRLGVGYNKHDGRLQETEGNVLEIDRNSLFYGGGFGLGGAPLAAGAAGPPRLFVNLSLADAYFKPLAASQEVAAHGAAERVASNDSLTEIAVAYHSLVEAYGKLANASSARDLAQNMVDLVENFEREGFSSKTEVHRARTDLGRWQRDVADAERLTMVRSAELARLLRLPAQVRLAPVEEFVMPVDYVDHGMDIDAMIAIAYGSRPEVSQHVARREAACFRVKEEKWRPWIPNVQVGASGGNFGGGPSTNYQNDGSRSDVDLIAVWEWKNLGLGNVALQRQRRGELHERVLELEAGRELIAAEVVAAAADVSSYRRQVELAQESIAAAQQSYELNEQRIRASEGLPIELLQSISALAEARNAYTAAVGNYNRAQYLLMRAMGNAAGMAG
ncbi:MAG: TolC family protein [Planctomycetes bacterium]|nr:TolC family protein [Planctomycetota bacterium]